MGGAPGGGPGIKGRGGISGRGPERWGGGGGPLIPWPGGIWPEGGGKGGRGGGGPLGAAALAPRISCSNLFACVCVVVKCIMTHKANLPYSLTLYQLWIYMGV